MNLFFLFEREYERSQVESIWELRLPIERVKKELEELCSVHYLSNLWIYTQLRRYEEELGAQLFRKDSAGCGKGSFYLSICDRMLTFSQKQHLYVSDKIKVANGAYDKITNEAADHRVRVFLGAGSTIYHLANILAERTLLDSSGGPRYSIRTHNLGALRRLLEPAVNHARLEITLPEGWETVHLVVPLRTFDDEMHDIPLTIYFGSLDDNVNAFIYLYWGFPNAVDWVTGEYNLWADGVQILRGSLIGDTCNLGVYDQQTFMVGGLEGVGAYYQAADCQGENDTAGWFTTVRVNNGTFAFYVAVEPWDARTAQHDNLQMILDSVTFLPPDDTEN